MTEVYARGSQDPSWQEFRRLYHKTHVHLRSKGIILSLSNVERLDEISDKGKNGRSLLTLLEPDEQSGKEPEWREPVSRVRTESNKWQRFAMCLKPKFAPSRSSCLSVLAQSILQDIWSTRQVIELPDLW